MGRTKTLEAWVLRDCRSALSGSEFGAERRAARDRRSTPRLRAELGCEAQTVETWTFRVSGDLSLTGLSLPSGHPYIPGSRVKLKLSLPDEEQPLEMQAHVVGRYDAHGGARLAFDDLDAARLRRLHKALLVIAESAAQRC